MYLGRKVKNKGIDTLLAAMPLVWEKNPEAQLLLVGQRADYFEKALLPQIERLPAHQRSRVVVVDEFEERDKYSYYCAADIVVMASCVDCFGLVYLESWLYGKPVIACRHYPQESIIEDGKDGYLIDYNHAEQLAEKLNWLIANPELQKRLGGAGKEKVLQKLNLQNYAVTVRGIYRAILRRSSRIKGKG